MNDYVGTELGLFQHATNWKTYYGRMIAPYLGQEVLEVGAGLGANTAWLCRPAQQRFTCLEPDTNLARQIQAKISSGALPTCCKVIVGTLDSLAPRNQFDSLVYIDVLEHIENDHAEARKALTALRPGGHLVVLSPAHPFLFSPFDASIGHYRRYSRASLGALVADRPLLLRYLDSFGMCLSLANRLCLRQKMPSLQQIQFWDKWVIPISRLMDPLLGYRVGKSVLGVWKK